MVDTVTPAEAYDVLKADPQAQMVDVRTDAEWLFVGVADLSAANKKPFLIPWQVFPAMQLNSGFVGAMKHAGATPEHKLYFMCRSGGRSMAAAQAMEAAGFTQVYNVAGGFEGDPDAEGHRGLSNGWKAEGLPWRQR